VSCALFEDMHHVRYYRVSNSTCVVSATRILVAGLVIGMDRGLLQEEL
jgi:hypothetical protein